MIALADAAVALLRAGLQSQALPLALELREELVKLERVPNNVVAIARKGRRP